MPHATTTPGSADVTTSTANGQVVSAPSPISGKSLTIPLGAVQAELARRGAVVEPVSADEKAFQKSEIWRCMADVGYWLGRYVVTHDPRLANPFIPFEPFPMQLDMINWLEERVETQTSGCIEKSKDVGATYVALYFLLHRWLWSEGFAGGTGSRKLEYVDSLGDPKSLFEKLRMTLHRLPSWMLPKGFDWRKHSMECRLINPSMHSTLTGEGGVQIGRGGRSSVYVVDEYNFMEHPELVDAALRDNTNVVIYMGTPNGLVGIYNKRSHLPCFRAHWKDDPRKNSWEKKNGAVTVRGSGPDAPAGAVYPWYELQKEKHRDKPWIVKQELDIDYLGSGHPRFDTYFLAELLAAAEKRVPILEERVGESYSSSWSGDVKTWKEPKRGHRYLIVSDVAEGESNDKGDPDWSRSHVYDVETWEQVCGYRGRMDTHAYAVDLAVLGEMYEWADIAVERTGPGLATIKALTEEIGYPSVWHQQMGENHAKAGITASATFKKTSENELAGYIGDMKEGFPGFVWNDPHTIKELIHFVVKPSGRAEAESGWHDDDVTCCKMAAVLLPMVSTRRKTVPENPPEPRVFYGNARGRR